MGNKSVKGVLTNLNLNRADVINESNGIDDKDIVLIDKIKTALARKHGNNFMAQGDMIVDITKAKDGVSFNIKTVTGDMPHAEGHFLSNAELEGKVVNDSNEVEEKEEVNEAEKEDKKEEDEEEKEEDKKEKEEKDEDEEEDKKKNESVQAIIDELKAKHSEEVDEKVKTVVKNGQKVKKKVPTKKKKMSSKQKQALKKAQKKSHTSKANKNRAKSNRKRKSMGLNNSNTVKLTSEEFVILENTLKELDVPVSVMESFKKKSLYDVVEYLEENHAYLFNNTPELSESQIELLKNFELVMEGIKKEAELDGEFGTWFETEILSD
ncbi:MAG: hypothetical protein ACOCRO_05425 [Halanaerobiales bacterium]